MCGGGGGGTCQTGSIGKRRVRPQPPASPSCGRGAGQTLQGRHRARRARPRVPEGTVLATAGPQRRRQDHRGEILTTLIDRRRGHGAVVDGVDVADDPRGVAARIGCRPVRRRRRVPHRLREPRDDRPPLPPRPPRSAERGPVSCWRRLAQTPPTARRRPTPAACGDGSTWPAALVAQPPILFLDEPTTGLDPRSRIDMWEVIRDLVSGRHHPAAHHPVPRGGRPPGRRHRRHRPRPGHRPGHRRRAEEPGGRRAHRARRRRRATHVGAAVELLGRSRPARSRSTRAAGRWWRPSPVVRRPALDALDDVDAAGVGCSTSACAGRPSTTSS